VIDLTCQAYEYRIRRLMYRSARLMRQLSRTSPKDPRMSELALKHRIIWNNIIAECEQYRAYTSVGWENGFEEKEGDDEK